MERVLVEAVVFLAAIVTIVWVVVQLLDRWVRRKRIQRMWEKNKDD